MNNYKLIIACFSIFVISCNTNKEELPNHVEYGIVAYNDTGVDTTELCEKRIITLHVRFINNQRETVYIPIHNSNSIQTKSRLLLYYKDKAIRTVISKSQAFNNGIISSGDTTYLKMIIYGSFFKEAAIQEEIKMYQLLPHLSLKYELCETDSIHSNYPLPKELQYVVNDSVLSLRPIINRGILMHNIKENE